MFRRLTGALALALAALPCTPALRAQGTEPPVRKATIVDSLARAVEHQYVDADTGRRIAELLRARAAAGAYDSVSNVARFAAQLTADLQSVNNDRHLSVQYIPPGAPAFQPGSFADREQHFGLYRLEALPGNIGYLEVGGFSSDTAGAREAITGALRYLEAFDAVILDLRRNRGGTAQGSNFLLSHFTGPEPIPVLTQTNREGQRRTRYTLAAVPGPRRPDVPLFVLTSGLTAAAGEDFAFVLKNLKRAVVVGERTRGAGHDVRFVDLGGGFVAGISWARVADPQTGKEWERVGVEPDVVADTNAALDVAHQLAVRELAKTAEGQRRALLQFVDRQLEARLHPIAISPDVLAQYAGRYEGGRRVWVVGSTIAYEAEPGAHPEVLTALSDATFAQWNGQTVSFVRGADGAIAMRAPGPTGTRTFARAPEQ